MQQKKSWILSLAEIQILFPRTVSPKKRSLIGMSGLIFALAV